MRPIFFQLYYIEYMMSQVPGARSSSSESTPHAAAAAAAAAGCELKLSAAADGCDLKPNAAAADGCELELNAGREVKPNAATCRRGLKCCLF